MESEESKSGNIRATRDPDQLPPCPHRQNRLFLSETVPPGAHQPASLNRSLNLSDRIHEYCEKLIRNSHPKKSDPHTFKHQLLGANLPPGYGDPYLPDCNPLTIPRYFEQQNPSYPIQSALQSAGSNVCVRHPCTAYMADSSGNFDNFEGKQHVNINYLFHKSIKNNEAPTSEGLNDPSSPSFTGSKVLYSPGPKPSQTSQQCHLHSCASAKQDDVFSVSCHSDGSSSNYFSKSNDEKQGDGSKDRIKVSFSKKRTVPTSIDVRCERNVIGQEKSPVSKSYPGGSGTVSTSSSNGDSVPRERKKWVRPPLVGQAASTDKSPFLTSAVFDCPDNQNSSLEKRKILKECSQLSSSTGSDQADSKDSFKSFSLSKSAYFEPGKSVVNCSSQNADEYCSGVDGEVLSVSACQNEGEHGLSDSCTGGRISPSSSVTSNRRLEWDSGADVGYNQLYNSASLDVSSSGLCTIERMALAQGCSVALQMRLDPEGTTVPSSSIGPTASVIPTPVHVKSSSVVGKPTAESTPLDQLPHVAKAFQRFQSDIGISPILQSQKEDGAEIETLDIVLQKEDGKDQFDSPTALTSKSSDSQGTTKSFKRRLSNSMQDLRKCDGNGFESQLSKSQSDPDLSGDTPTLVSTRTVKLKLSKQSKQKNSTDIHATGHSVSSGSDATLVHGGTEEDLTVDADDNFTIESNLEEKRKTSSDCTCEAPGFEDLLSLSHPVAVLGQKTSQAIEKPSSQLGKPLKPSDCKQNEVFLQSKNPKQKSDIHVCSDSDHKRGLHHHFGVLCSSILGGNIQTSHSNVGSQIPNPVVGLDRVHAFSPCTVQDQSHNREATLSPTLQEPENFAGESTESSALQSDAAHEEHAPGASTLSGRANSFEYLPGHMYENNPQKNLRKHERPPGISTSTETDSESARPGSRSMHRKVDDTSSHDTEDDRLWVSPRIGSNTLVQDLERGVSLLKGVMENKSAGRRCKRELIRRIIRKLVTSEYVEDVIEQQKARHLIRSPFSPRKTKYQERPDRNLRSKRCVAPERQAISGESDEPKQRIPNVRRKLSSHQSVHHPQSRLLSTLADGSKSSSLWSSRAESTGGSITLSGSSNNGKETNSSMKMNPTSIGHVENTSDWLKPATQSEKLFEMRKNGASQGEKHLAGLLGIHDPVALKNDPQKQLTWITNEINQLKILKQLLQKQETLKQSLNPNSEPITAMPLTGLRQTLRTADCSTSGALRSHSPKLKTARLQQWVSLESDTSAGFGLSNHTESSQDSHWQDVEVTQAGEQAHHPHRTVSISDGDQVTDASCSLSNRKSDASQSSGAQIAYKSRHRSVSISDADQLLGPSGKTYVPVQKKRSDCRCLKSEGKVYNSRPTHVTTYGVPSRNLVSEKQVCQHCSSQNHTAQRETFLPAGAIEVVSANRDLSSHEQLHIGIGGQQLSDYSTKAQACVCVSTRPYLKKCCCSPESRVFSQRGGEGGKEIHQVPQKFFSQVVSELPSTSSQPLSNGGLVRVHIETDQKVDKNESQLGPALHDRVQISEISDQKRGSISQPSSGDSLTQAVTEAVSSKVKALRNLGQIEEAEVNIRVKVASGQVSSDATPHSEKGRVLKSQDLEDEGNFHPSKHSEPNEVFARQVARDFETRQKLLAIAETRQRAQMGLHDIDRRIQDLLLEDYVSRQMKTPETSRAPHARLNVRVEAPAQTPVHATVQASSVGVQSEVDKKTVGTSTITPNLERNSPKPLGTASSKRACICDQAPATTLQSVVTQSQQTDTPLIHQTAPTLCMCSCQSQPNTSPRTYRASSPYFPSGRPVEFELELHKQRPYNMSPFEVHQTLKSRNTAYFLQIEEDHSTHWEPEKEIMKPPMEVVKIKVPKQKQATSHPPASSRNQYPQRRKSRDNVEVLQKVKSSVLGSEGRVSSDTSSSEAEVNLENHSLQSKQPDMEFASTTNVLRVTPGRSHLSVTVTDSSGESVLSQGDSRDSTSQHYSRKSHKSGRSSKWRENIRFQSETVQNAPKQVRSPSNTISGQSNRQASNESLYDLLGGHDNAVPSLQDYLEKNHPKYLDAAEKRRRCIAEMSYLRRLRQQSRKRLFELEGDNLRAKQKQQWKSRCASRPKPALKKRPMPKTTRSSYVRRYMIFPESEQRFAELKKKEEKRTNRLMAEIYTRKLQEKVLKGSATIRSSVSVLSSL